MINFKNIESKSAIGIFDNDDEKKVLIDVAANYWVDELKNAGTQQISYEMGNGLISVSDRSLDLFKQEFVNYISKVFPKTDDYIMLWTSNGEYFDRIGTDSYLRKIMEECNLPLTCLPSDLTMWIYKNYIDVMDNYQHKRLYSSEKTK